MSIQNVSFMSAKPSNAVVKKAEELKEKAVYYGKEPMGELKKKVNHRASDLKSYLDSRQQIIEDNTSKVAADELAEAYKSAHGIMS